MKLAVDHHEKNPEIFKAAFGENYADNIGSIKQTVNDLHSKNAQVRLDVPPGQDGEGAETPFTKVGDQWKPGPIVLDNHFHGGELISGSC